MLTVNPSEVIWTILCFLALYFVLKRFLFDPLVAFMDARDAAVQSGLDEESAARALVDEEQRGVEAAREESLRKARALLNDQKTADEQHRTDAIAAAHRRAAELEQESKEQAETLSQQSREALAAQSAALTRVLADRLLEAGNLAIEKK